MRDEYTRTTQPSRARAAKTFNLERTLSDLVNRAYANHLAPDAATAPPVHQAGGASGD